MFFKVSNFAKTLSFYIYNTGYNIDDFDEEEFHLDIINNTKQYIETNITKYNMNDIPVDKIIHEIKLRVDLAKMSYNAFMIRWGIHKISKRLLYTKKDKE